MTILGMHGLHSRYAWVAFINFKDIGLKIQNEKGYPIERIRSDKGREFDNSDFFRILSFLRNQT